MQDEIVGNATIEKLKGHLRWAIAGREPYKTWGGQWYCQSCFACYEKIQDSDTFIHKPDCPYKAAQDSL
jgi:hypothetical protein